MELQFSYLATLLLLFLVIMSKTHKRTVQNLPPGPWQLPFIGNLHQLIGSLPHHCLRDLAKKYGPLMHLQLGQVSTIIVSSPRLAKEVMKTHDIAFANRPEVLVTKIMFYDQHGVAFSQYGDHWRQLRKICVMELLSNKNVQSFRGIREVETFHLVESIRASPGRPICLTDMIFSLTSAIVCRAAFGMTCEDQDTLIRLMKEAVLLVGGLGLVDLFPSLKLLHFVTSTKRRLQKMHQKVDENIQNLIDEHQKHLGNTRKGHSESGEEDLVDVLLRLKESGSLDIPITNTNIKAVIFDMFAAGTETTANVTEWAMSEIIRNPRVMQKAQAELRQALNGKKKVYENDIEKLSYLKLIIKETLRLHPVAPLLIPRVCREECELDGYKIPVKTKVMVNAWAIGRDPENWGNPESFEPERFQNSSVDFMGNHFEFIPFGAGRRICPGISFGITEVELVLAQLLYNFDWKLPNGMKSETLDMTEVAGAASRRKNKLVLIAKPLMALPL